MKNIDVVGIGNALVDVIVEVGEEVLERLGLRKGGMHLVEKNQSEDILRNFKDYRTILASGGSVANSLAGLSAMGSRTKFLGSVGNDAYAETFLNDLEAHGVRTHLARDTNLPTGYALTLITPDGERTFATYIGAAANLSKEEVPEDLIRDARVLYIEGYTLAHKKAREAAFHAARLAAAHNTAVALGISDVSMVQDYGEYVRKMIEDHADIVFANTDEARVYTGKKRSVAALGRSCNIAVVTDGADGSTICAGNILYDIPAVQAKVVNTSGAGDMYAAGVLRGIVQGFPYKKVGDIASFFAAKTVEHQSARLPQEYVKNEYKKRFGRKKSE